MLLANRKERSVSASSSTCGFKLSTSWIIFSNAWRGVILYLSQISLTLPTTAYSPARFNATFSSANLFSLTAPCSSWDRNGRCSCPLLRTCGGIACKNSATLFVNSTSCNKSCKANNCALSPSNVVPCGAFLIIASIPFQNLTSSIIKWTLSSMVRSAPLSCIVDCIGVLIPTSTRTSVQMVAFKLSLRLLSNSCISSTSCFRLAIIYSIPATGSVFNKDSSLTKS